MISGVYASASSLLSLEKSQNIITHNLANANTMGYKRNRAKFSTFEEALASEGVQTTAELAKDAPMISSEIDFSSGNTTETGNPLDLAIQGKAFFVLQSPTGLRYTRKGNFCLSTDRKIVSDAGWPLQGRGGDITAPEGTKTIRIDLDGNVYADGESIDQISLAEVVDPDQVLVRSDHTTFRTMTDTGAALPASTMAKVHQGRLERSNVSVMHELVAMIATLRMFEANQRMLVQQDGTLQKLTQFART